MTHAYPIFAAGTADGIGFQLKRSYMLAVDLDRVRDMTTGEITPRGKELIAEAAKIIGLYREVTVSGTGVRFIGLSNNAEPSASQVHARSRDRRGDRALSQLRALHHGQRALLPIYRRVRCSRRSTISSTSCWPGSTASDQATRQRRRCRSISTTPDRSRRSITRI